VYLHAFLTSLHYLTLIVWKHEKYRMFWELPSSLLRKFRTRNLSKTCAELISLVAYLKIQFLFHKNTAQPVNFFSEIIAVYFENHNK
jgi:hypothetical protein